jgi:hypothetical protein
VASFSNVEGSFFALFLLVQSVELFTISNSQQKMPINRLVYTSI